MKEMKGNIPRRKRRPRKTREARTQGKNAALKRSEGEEGEAPRYHQVTLVRDAVGGVKGTEA